MSQDQAPVVAQATRNGAPTAHPKELRDKAFALFQQGKQYVDIAYELRLPAATLRAWSKRDNWDQRKAVITIAPTISAETAAMLAKRVVEPLTVASQADKLDLAEKQVKYQEDMAAVALRIAEETRAMDSDTLFARANKIKDLDTVARKALKLEQDKPTTIVQIALLNQPQARADSKQAALEADTIDV